MPLEVWNRTGRYPCALFRRKHSLHAPGSWRASHAFRMSLRAALGEHSDGEATTESSRRREPADRARSAASLEKTGHFLERSEDAYSA